MNCKIDTTPDFARELKQLAKRYPSMKDDYRDLGKSGGARVITHTVLLESDGADITLVTIYDKSNQANISDKELKKLIKKNGLE